MSLVVHFIFNYYKSSKKTVNFLTKNSMIFVRFNAHCIFISEWVYLTQMKQRIQTG